MISLAFSIVIESFSIREVRTSKHILDNKNDTVLHWLQFLSYVLPCLVIVFVYSADDMFAKFNKFPEQISNVSILQFPQYRDVRESLILNKSSSSTSDSYYKKGSSVDLFGFEVNRTLSYHYSQNKDPALLLAYKTIRDDDPELLERYQTEQSDHSESILSSISSVNDDGE